MRPALSHRGLFTIISHRHRLRKSRQDLKKAVIISAFTNALTRCIARKEGGDEKTVQAALLAAFLRRDLHPDSDCRHGGGAPVLQRPLRPGADGLHGALRAGRALHREPGRLLGLQDSLDTAHSLPAALRHTALLPLRQEAHPGAEARALQRHGPALPRRDGPPLLTEHPGGDAGRARRGIAERVSGGFRPPHPASRRRRRSTIPSATSSSPPCSRPSRARRSTYSWSSS